MVEKEVIQDKLKKMDVKALRQQINILKDTIIVRYANTYSGIQRKKLTDHKTKEYIVTTQKITIPAKSRINRDYPLIIFDSKTFETFLKHICKMEDDEISVIKEEFGVDELKKEFDEYISAEIKRINQKISK